MFNNGSNGIRIKKTFSKSTGPKKLELTKDNSFLVFPFELVAGYITSTENGLRQNDNINIEDYSNFQRVFTGLENMLAKWDEAYEVKKVNANDGFLTKTYKVGRNLRAFIPNESLGASFEPSSISNDFLTEFTDEEFTMHAYEDIKESDLFKLFIIPELREEKWLYISNAERFFHNGKFHHIEITMTTLNNKVAKSGRSIESFIQRGAPGEGYAWPLVDFNQDVKLGDVRNRDVPITSVQIEMAGPAAINTIVAYGRPTIQKVVNGITESTFNPKIEAPRLLLPLRYETAIPSPENTRPSAETDYYYGNFKPTLQESYKDWKDQMQGSFSLEERNKYEGVLIGDTLAKLRLSNPIDSKGTHTHELWDNNWLIDLDQTYDTSTNNIAESSITLKGNYKSSEILAHQFFITSYLTSLPLTVQQNVAWRIQNLPIIGGYISKLTLGIPIGWQNLAIRLAMPSVNFFVPSSIAEYGNVLKGDGTPSTDVWIPLETFTAERKDQATEYSGINATGTIFKVQLTHRFKKTINGALYTFDTKDLGQTHPTSDDNGKSITGNLPTYLLWDGTCQPTDRGNVPGYVIDISHFKSLAKLDYRLTFFSNDAQVWSGTYQTQAEFTGSIRDWTNIVKMSNWKEDNNQVVSYPKSIVAPNPPNSTSPVIEIDSLKGVLLDFRKGITDDGRTKYLYFDEYWRRYFDENQLENSFFGPATSGSNPIRDLIFNGKTDKNSFTSVFGSVPSLIQKLTYDTSLIGGINSVKNNYLSLKLNLTLNGVASPITFSITDLINANKKVISVGKSNIEIWGPISVDSQGRTTFFTKDYISKQEVETFLEVSINGNLIELSSYVIFKNTGTNEFIEKNKNVSIKGKLPELEIIKIILSPKTI